MTLKIALIYPSMNRKTTYTSVKPELQNFFDTNKYLPSFFLPSLSLLTIAGCTPHEYIVEIIDERVSEVPFDQSFDIVGISIITQQARRGYQIAKKFKERGIFTVIGGIHASVLPQEAKNYCDAVVIGEAELNWPKLLKDFINRKPKNYYYYAKQVPLHSSPIPRYDLVNTEEYNLFPLQTTRGCPHNCSFCSVTQVFGAGYRTKAINQVVKEINMIQRFSSNRRIVFNDDNMLVNRKYSYQLLDALIPLNIRYFAQSDVSIAEDDKLLNLLSKSGCNTIFIGFESLIPENLQSLQHSRWKYNRLKAYSEACKRIQSHGIQVLGAFIVGFDYDTPAVFQELLEFTLENKILGQYHVLTPFPGTRIRNDLIKDKRLGLNENNWDLYSCFDVLFFPKLMSKSELEMGLLHLYQSVYSKNFHITRSRHMIELIKDTTRIK